MLKNNSNVPFSRTPRQNTILNPGMNNKKSIFNDANETFNPQLDPLITFSLELDPLNSDLGKRNEPVLGRPRRNTILNTGMNNKASIFNDAIETFRPEFDPLISDLVDNISNPGQVDFLQRFSTGNNKVFICGGAAYYLYGESFRKGNLKANCPRTHDYDIYAIANNNFDPLNNTLLDILKIYADSIDQKIRSKQIYSDLFSPIAGNYNPVKNIHYQNEYVSILGYVHIDPNTNNQTITYNFDVSVVNQNSGQHIYGHIIDIIIYNNITPTVFYDRIDRVESIQIGIKTFNLIPIKYLIGLSLNALLNRIRVGYINGKSIAKARQDACRIKYLLTVVRINRNIGNTLINDSSFKLLNKIFNNILDTIFNGSRICDIVGIEHNVDMTNCPYIKFLCLQQLGNANAITTIFDYIDSFINEI